MSKNKKQINFDDYLYDDIVQNHQEKKKKKRAKPKGNRGELELSKILNNKFNSNEFSRSLGSGNRWSQVDSVKADYIGDLVVPTGFRFTIECKTGYSEIDLGTMLSKGNPMFDTFLKQATDDAKKAKKQPLLAWRRDRKKWLFAINEKEIEEYSFQYLMKYRNWSIIHIDQFLSIPNNFFLN